MSHKKIKNEPAYTVHPYEIAFCGFSRTGKTTLITRLIKKFSKNYKVAYLKHNVHGFEVDHDGKDTYQASRSGARSIFIGDADHCAIIQNGPYNLTRYQDVFLENDFAFIEGYKCSPIPKIIFIDEDEEILEDIRNNPLENILAFCGVKDVYPALPVDVPYFQRDDIRGVQTLIDRFFQEQAAKIPVFGLVLAGGKSTRMKKDKSRIHYHGQSQIEYCYGLLSKVCQKIFISNRDDQSMMAEHKNLPQIHDVFLNMGPLGGILSAMTAYPRAAWLVLACDLPFVTLKTLEQLISQRNPFKMATAYRSADDHWPEPLCAIYEPKGFLLAMKSIACGINCPRKILAQSDVEIILQGDQNVLENVNSPEEYIRAIKRIQ
jgi:molybdopterin-guanine dinucleotide biosynthesis protein MobB